MNEAIANAVARLKAGEDPASVLRFIYRLGETEGMLAMAFKAEKQILELLDAA